MEIWTAVLLFLLGLALIIKGGDWFLSGAVWIATTIQAAASRKKSIPAECFWAVRTAFISYSSGVSRRRMISSKVSPAAISMPGKRLWDVKPGIVLISLK